MIIPGLLGELLFWSPLIVTGIMAIVIDPKYWAVFSSIFGFWVGVLPAIPIQLAFIAFFKLIITRIKALKTRSKERRAQRANKNIPVIISEPQEQNN